VVRIVSRLALVLLLSAQMLVVSCGNWGERRPAMKPPLAPEELSLRIVSQGLLASWTPAPGATHYTLFWGTERGEYWGFTDASQCSLIVANLSPAQLYYFAVTAWNEKGESNYSPERPFVYDNDKTHAGEYVSRARQAMADGWYADAQAYVSAALRLDPDNAEAQRFRAILHEKMQRSGLARDDHSEADKLTKKKALSADRFKG
jgi:hypothetical protein